MQQYLLFSDNPIAADVMRGLGRGAKYPMHPLLTALVELQISATAISKVLGTSPQLWTGILRGRVRLSTKYLPQLERLLEETLQYAMSAIQLVREDPAYLEDWMSSYEERVRQAGRILEHWRQRTDRDSE